MSIDVQPTVRPNLTEQVAEEIRVLLTRRRMSGRQLAARLGVSQTWLSSRLVGSTPIDLNDLQRIAEVLQVTPADLLPSTTQAGHGRVTGNYRPAAPRTPSALITGHGDRRPKSQAEPRRPVLLSGPIAG